MNEAAKPTWPQITVGAAAIIGMISLLYWKDIKRTDLYQRNFNSEAWKQRQQQKVERNTRLRELDLIECNIMLRAKASMVPVEIERSILLGMSYETASQMAIDELEQARTLCEKHGI